MLITNRMLMIRHERLPSSARRAPRTMTALLAFSLLFAPAVVAASVSESQASAGDARCLKCHAKNLQKILGDGEKLSLHVASAELANSAHGGIGCTGCHAAIAGKKHPAKEPISSRRAFTLDQNQNCRGCHAEKFTLYEGSIHASLVADGNATAPVCTDCHSAHTIETMAAYEPVTGLPCKNCHEAIYDAYAQSVHGKARSLGNTIRADHIQAPVCMDCHHAHEVTAVAAGDQLRATCLSCHDDAGLAHEKWLPNTDLHMSVVSCPACHSPLAQRTIDLELYDKVARVPVGAQDSFDGIGAHMDGIGNSGNSVDAAELWKLVRESSREGKAVEVTLRGRMKVHTGVQAHQLAVKAEAVRNCDACHRKGSAAFQNVTVSIASPDGRKKYYAADSNVLRSMVSVDSVSDFYAMGGTRIGLLDGLLILALIGGLAIPVGHLTIGRLLKRKR